MMSIKVFQHITSIIAFYIFFAVGNSDIAIIFVIDRVNYAMIRCVLCFIKQPNYIEYKSVNKFNVLFIYFVHYFKVMNTHFLQRLQNTI